MADKDDYDAWKNVPIVSNLKCLLHLSDIYFSDRQEQKKETYGDSNNNF